MRLGLVGTVSVTDGFDVLELLVENLMHLDGFSFIFVDLIDGMGEVDPMLEATRGQLFVLLHQWPNVIKPAVDEALTNRVLVVLYLVRVELLVLLNELLQVLLHAVVRVDGEARGADSLVVLIVELGNVLAELGDERAQAQLAVHLDEPGVDRDGLGVVLQCELAHRDHLEVDRIEDGEVVHFDLVEALKSNQDHIFSVLSIQIA